GEEGRFDLEILARRFDANDRSVSNRSRKRLFAGEQFKVRDDLRRRQSQFIESGLKQFDAAAARIADDDELIAPFIATRRPPHTARPRRHKHPAPRARSRRPPPRVIGVLRSFFQSNRDGGWRGFRAGRLRDSPKAPSRLHQSTRQEKGRGRESVRPPMMWRPPARSGPRSGCRAAPGNSTSEITRRREW